MKATLTKRLLSAVLAILMVVAICPVIALAAVPGSITTAWDGKVEQYIADLDDYTEITDIPAFILSGADYVIDVETMAAAGLALTEVVNPDNGKITYAMTISSEKGFAMFVLLSNCPFTIVGGASDGTDLTGAAGSGLLDLINGQPVTLAADLNLDNQPIAPIFWKGQTQSTWYTFTFDGAGHAIYNWNVTQTITSNAYTEIGFVGFYKGQSLTVKNLALMNQTIAITTTDAVTSTVEVGGIVGGMFDCAQQSYSGLTVSDVIVDLDASVTLPKTTSYGDWWVGGVTNPALVGGIAGQLGRRPIDIYNGWGPKNVTITNTNIIMNGTTNTQYSVVAGITYCANTNKVDTDPKPSTTLDDITILFTQSGPAKTVSSTYAAALANNDANTVGDIFVNVPSTTVTGDSVVDAQGYDLAEDAFWTANSANVDGMTKLEKAYPFSEVFANNEAIVEDMTARGESDITNRDALLEQALINEIKGGAMVEIDSADKLVKVATLANDNNAALSMKLTANIDMTGKVMPVITKLKDFDGQGFVISNLTQNVVYTGTTGGFCATLTGDVKDVAFVNYNVTFCTADPSAATEYSVGGLFGQKLKADKVETYITNVYMEGSLAITGTTKGNTRIGYFAAPHQSWVGHGATGITMDNCIFVGQVKGGVANFFAGYFGGAAGSWDSAVTAADGNGKYTLTKEYRQIKLNNCYAIPYTVDAGTGVASLVGHVGNNIGSFALAMKNCYQPGLTASHQLNHGGAIGYEDVIDAEGNSLWYLDCFNVGDVANGKTMETSWNGPDAAFSLKQFQGLAADNAMQFSNEADWLFFADGTPIPAVFGDNAEALSVKSIDTLAEKDAPINFMGAQLRVDKEGIRFVAEFDVERYAEIAAGDGYTVEYGFLVLPTVAITTYGQELVYENDLALKIATSNADQLLAEGDARLNGIVPATEGNKIMLAVMKGIPAEVLKSNTSFTVVPYIAFVYDTGAAVIYGAEKEYNGVALANLACAAGSVEAPETIAAIKELFAGVEGFAPEQ